MAQHLSIYFNHNKLIVLYRFFSRFSLQAPFRLAAAVPFEILAHLRMRLIEFLNLFKSLDFLLNVLLIDSVTVTVC